MYKLTITLSDNASHVLEMHDFQITSKLVAEDLIREMNEQLVAFDDADTKEGAVITPLPPNKVHSTTGLISPKPPLQVRREMGERMSDLPDEYRDSEDVEA
jgi:hypothetical protein